MNLIWLALWIASGAACWVACVAIMRPRDCFEGACVGLMAPILLALGPGSISAVAFVYALDAQDRC